MKKKSSHITLTDLPPAYQRQAIKQLAHDKKTDNRTTIRGAVQKQDRRAPLHPSAEIPRFHTPVRVTVHVWKCGTNWDADNIETKGVVDSLVKNGIIANDTIKEAPQVLKEGSECERKEDEKTVITVEEIRPTSY